jgi:hypothetical protein
MAKINFEPSTPEEAALALRFTDGKHSQADVTALRRIMRDKPNQLSRAADLCAVAFEDAIRLADGDNALFAELVRDRREVLRGELGYEQALPAEKLLVDEVALCWLRHYQAELIYTHSAADKNRTMEQGGYWEKRVAATQRRYLRAIETLARVGKLLRSVTLQVNIANKQVNVAGGNAPAVSGPADLPDTAKG